MPTILIPVVDSRFRSLIYLPHYFQSLVETPNFLDTLTEIFKMTFIERNSMLKPSNV